jgi:phosphopentomutase
LFDATLEALAEAGDRSIIFTNFVDFDMLYGHRRDVAGYAAALEYFDGRLPELLESMRRDDLLIITADHGCDPTWEGSDHTREHIPVLAFGNELDAGSLGKRKTFADIGQSLATYFVRRYRAEPRDVLRFAADGLRRELYLGKLAAPDCQQSEQRQQP